MPVLILVVAAAAAVTGLALRPRFGRRFPPRLLAGVLLPCAVAVVLTGAIVPALVLVAAAGVLLARA